MAPGPPIPGPKRSMFPDFPPETRLRPLHTPTAETWMRRLHRGLWPHRQHSFKHSCGYRHNRGRGSAVGPRLR
eukprot:9452732-Prorocentrum_lima.AAC.1